MMKLILKWVAIILAIFVLAGAAGIIFDRTVMPWLSSKESLKRYKFFQKLNDRVTVINKTEQITVKEDFSVTKTAQGVTPAIVSIVTYNEKNSQEVALKIKSSQDIQNFIRTGIIITSDGLVMSVMDETETDLEKLKQQKYRILASDGKEFDAQVKAIDPYSRIIFYKAEASNLSAPVFGNSDELESGEKIILAGNATGEYQNTFSMGIVKERDKTFTLLNSELASSERMEGAIITDAEIDERNIGGPVLDFNGSIVGVVNQVQKDGKKVGFIIPINRLKDPIDKVIKEGTVNRPTLGVYYLSINREIALLNHLPVDQGALVYSFTGQQGLAVLKNSPADLAGIRIGDIITKINDDKVTLDAPLSILISRINKGQEVKLTVLRGKETIEIKARLN